MGSTYSDTEYEEFSQFCDENNMHPEVPTSVDESLQHNYPALNGHPNRLKKVYDAAVRASIAGAGIENFQFLSKMHALKASPTQSNFQAAFELIDDTRRPYVNIGYSIRNALQSAVRDSKDGDWTTSAENHPKKGNWKRAEDAIIGKMKSFLTYNFPREPEYAAVRPWLITSAKESYYNELLDFDEYNDDNQLGQSQYISMHPYNGNNNGYNDYNYGSKYVGYKSYNYGNDNFGLMDPSLIWLVGVMFCLCLIFAALLNVISCAGCYVFGRYQYKNKNKNKNIQNHIHQYEEHV